MSNFVDIDQIRSVLVVRPGLKKFSLDKACRAGVKWAPNIEKFALDKFLN